MSTTSSHAQVVVPCDDLGAALPVFLDELGFALRCIAPADAPRIALLMGHGLHLRLEQHPTDRARCPVLVRVPSTATTPGPTQVEGADIQIEWIPTDLAPPHLESWQDPEPVVSRLQDTPWGLGRAGMHYRDLIPHRCGGRIIASHIRIEAEGPVPDQVHFHDVNFQVICCIRGWVEVVYQDQGPPFRLTPGDVVLQPPGMRHRVLQASAGLEVLELSTPAEHPTWMDHEMALPTAHMRPRQLFDGQHFVRHRGADSPWIPQAGGWETQTTEVHAATRGRGSVRFVRNGGSADGTTQPPQSDHAGILRFVTAGCLGLEFAGQPSRTLTSGDCVFAPPGVVPTHVTPSDDLTMIEIGVGLELAEHGKGP